jgi:tetratricopeptide (TPR) repeat protein
MSAKSHKDRQVIPRWKPFGLAVQTKEAVPLMRAADLWSPFFEARLNEWSKVQDHVLAGEIVGCACILGQEKHPVVHAAATFLLESPHASSINRATASRILGLDAGTRRLWNVDTICREFESIESHRETIAALRKRLRNFERDPTRWMDLAYYYVIIGEKSKAKRCVTTALGLGGHNRLVARSAARFFVHSGNGDHALKILRKAAAEVDDPWIVSAEVAIAESLNTKSKLIDKGVSMLRSRSGLQAVHVSELASAIGTIDLAHGSVKRGRNRFQLAMEDPTENAVAQAEWANNQIGKTIFHPDVELQFEADASKALRNGEFERALDSCWKWLCLQPFSARPGVHGSYIALVALGDQEAALRFIRASIKTSSDSFLLRNNNAVALAYKGELTEAMNEMNKLLREDLDADENATAAATIGLIQFRSGRIQEGREGYNRAIEGFRREGSFTDEVLAKLFWLQEELEAGGKISEREFEELDRGMRKIREPEYRQLFARVKGRWKARERINEVVRDAIGGHPKGN